jgi:hypothetical protein
MTEGIAVRGLASGGGACWPKNLPVMRQKQNTTNPQHDFAHEPIGCLEIDRATDD